MNFTHPTGHQVETDDTIRLSSPEPVPLRALATVQEGPEKPSNDRPPPPTLPPGTPSVDLYFAVPVPFLIGFVILLFKTCLLVDPKCCVPHNTQFDRCYLLVVFKPAKASCHSPAAATPGCPTSLGISSDSRDGRVATDGGVAAHGGFAAYGCALPSNRVTEVGC